MMFSWRRTVRGEIGFTHRFVFVCRLAQFCIVLLVKFVFKKSPQLLGQVFRAGCRNKSNCFGFHDEKIRLGISLVARVNHGYPVTDSGAVGSIQTN